MNIDAIKKIASTPRTVDGELKTLVRPTSPVYDLCSRIALWSLLATILVAIATGLGYGSWMIVAIFGGVFVLARVGVMATKGAAMKQGKAILAEQTLCLAAVVQANNALYETGDAMLPAVLVYSTDSAKAVNLDWIQGVAQAIAACKDKPDGTPAEQHVYQQLTNERSRFIAELLPAELIGDDTTYWTVMNINPILLPDNKIPAEGVIPYFISQTNEKPELMFNGVLPKTLWA